MDKKLWQKGLAKRKAVLGAEHVDESMASADDFNCPFQDMLAQEARIVSARFLPRGGMALEAVTERSAGR